MASGKQTGMGGQGGEARIGRATRVRGRVTGSGNLVVEGHLEGDVDLRGDLVVEEGATLASSVTAGRVVVRGELDGDVSAEGQVSLSSTAKVRGDLRGSAVSIEEGAVFAGRLDADFELPPELGGTTARRR